MAACVGTGAASARNVTAAAAANIIRFIMFSSNMPRAMITSTGSAEGFAPAGKYGCGVLPQRGGAKVLLQLDGAVDLMAQPDLADGEHHLRRQRLVALDAAFCNRGADGLLDFLLRGDADHFQEFSQRHVEGFFVHRGLRARGNRWAGA